jgi:hypothetical protein
MFNDFNDLETHIVKPVLLYGSEVWGTSMVNKINKEERFLFNLNR